MFLLGKRISYAVIVACGIAFHAAAIAAPVECFEIPLAHLTNYPLELQVVHRRDDTSGQATYVIALLEPISQDSPMIYALDGIEASAHIKGIAQSQFDVSFQFNSSQVSGRSAIRYTAAVGEIVTLPQLDGSNVYLKLVENRR
ncbi:hypothetical protein ACOTJQ_28875 [Achromobacter xylosoxidans]|uniref:hypothetical protein n=1 Tax=Achromobacter ruhlandii TaxID=72557 RepID=UPI003B9AA769